MLYKFLLVLAKIILRCIFRIKIEGRENIPESGGMILAVNHRSNWDVLFAGIGCTRPLRFMAKSELFKNKVFGALITNLGAFPVHRGRGDVGAIKSALSILKNDNVMLMFPEGHRVKDGSHPKPKLGVAMIAVHAKVPVVPLCISGEYKFMRMITVKFGEAIYFDDYYGTKPDNETLLSLSQHVMDTVYSLGV